MELLKRHRADLHEFRVKARDGYIRVNLNDEEQKSNLLELGSYLNLLVALEDLEKEGLIAIRKPRVTIPKKRYFAEKQAYSTSSYTLSLFVSLY